MRRWRVVILSARAENLVPCVRALLRHEPALHPADIIVVDDGAKQDAAQLLPSVTWVSGEKPFVFAQNANIGIRSAADADVLLLNDDAQLVTPGGISRMAALVSGRADTGLCSAAVSGVIGNARQRPMGTLGLRLEADALAFVAVFIPRHVYERLGPFDERFVGYGWEDNDYCDRARAAGFACAVADECVVDHSGELPSTFRTRTDVFDRYEINRRLYQRKATMTDRATTPVDIMFPACNRLEFTRETFGALLANTDWTLVNELHVYDDGSVDGTRQWLAERMADVPCRSRLVDTRWGSPVMAMCQFIESATAPMLAKVDNDAMMPPGWLHDSLEVFGRHPHLDFLGIEALYPVDAQPGIPRSFTPSPWISGLGLYRRHAFHASRPAAFQKYYGLEEWQQAQGTGLVKGWITPALPVFLLDRCPFEPWISLTERYIARGWMRPWFKHDPECALWTWRWSNGMGLPLYRPVNGETVSAAKKRRGAGKSRPRPSGSNGRSDRGSGLSETPAAKAYLHLLKKTLIRMPLTEADIEMRSEVTGFREDRLQEIDRWITVCRSGGNDEAGDPLIRSAGRDWPSTAESMIGMYRMDNVHACVLDVLQRGVPGDLIEAGVWRGGVTIFMRAVLEAFGVPDRRVWVADSFAGYTPPDPAFPADDGDPHRQYRELIVPLDTVKHNFARYGLLDERVVFAPGWFRDTLPALPIDRLAVLRIDADMYESTSLALRTLYAKVSPGGYVIVDDYNWGPCRLAVDEFREQMGIADPLTKVDWTGVMWKVS
jgi:GT2 family glycosyltransferase